MQEENMGTAIVTPASARAYCSARLPKKMQNPENMANPMEDAFSCKHMLMSAAASLQGRHWMLLLPSTEPSSAAESCSRQCMSLSWIAKKMQIPENMANPLEDAFS